MLDRQSLEFVDTKLKYSIKKTLSLEERTILYDSLIFLSINAETKMFCSESDINAFKELSKLCSELNISLSDYVGCAYNYIQKYSTPGHRLGLSYLLNESVTSFCGSKMDSNSHGSLLTEQIKLDVLTTEKQIRSLISNEVTYQMAFGKLLKRKQISPYFIAYKKFCNSDLVSGYSSDYLDKLVEVLEPFFTYILAKNQIYTPYKIKSWNNSKVKDYSFCPVYFTQRYITNELSDDMMGNEATDQGTAVHSIFETILKRYSKNKTKDLVAIATRFFNSKAFKDIEGPIADHIPFVKEQFLNTNSFLHTCLANNKVEILIEHSMSGMLEGTSFYGTADLILISGNDAHILDYKTSKLDLKYLPKNNKEYNKQLSLYSQLLKVDRPNIANVKGTLIYTRGLIQPLELDESICVERSREIETIKKNLKSGVLVPNTSSCFLCRHPHCRFRTRPSIWNEDGTRKLN